MKNSQNATVNTKQFREKMSKRLEGVYRWQLKLFNIVNGEGNA